MKKAITIFLAFSAVAMVGYATGFSFRSSSAETISAEGIAPFVVHHKLPSATDSKGVALNPLKGSSFRAKAKDVPFIEDFTTSGNLGDWYIQDVNNDGNSWEYKESFGLLRCYSFDSNDDWVITPAINLGKEDVYTLTFSYGSQGSRYAPEHLTVTMGTSEYGTRHTTVLYEDAEILNFWNGSMKTVTLTLPVAEDGAYYFGFHSTSANGYCLYLDDIRVEQNGTKAAPEAVTGLSVAAGAKGEPEATLDFTAPLTAADGSVLSAITSIAVYRDELKQPVHTIAEPLPGSSHSFTDTGLDTGMHTWRVVASLNGEEGAKAEITTYVGIDTPMAVTSLTAAEQTDGSVRITWDAPVGNNGGYVGNDVVTYRIVRHDGTEETVLGTALETASFADTTLDTGKQGYVYYSVEASTKEGTSPIAESNSLFTGPAYQIPFKETFAYGTLRKSPWVMETVVNGLMNPQWAIVAQGTQPLCPTIDGDDGMLAFNTLIGGMNLYQGAHVRIATPVIDLSGTEDPYLTFYLFHFDTTVIEQEYDSEKEEYITKTYTYDDKVRVQISVDNGPYTDIPDAEIKLAANNSGWTKYEVSLAKYRNARKASIGLLGIADGGGNIHVDNLLVTDRFASDLEITDILGPQSVKIGETAEYLVTVVNNGAASTKNYTVGLYIDGELVETQSNPGAAIFANGGEKSFRFSFTPSHRHSGAMHKLYARISFPDDMCAANDTSDEIDLEVPAVSLPSVAVLDGAQNGNSVDLCWEEPDLASFRMARHDDMEQMRAFAINGIADYTLVDNDKSSTYCISGITDYENAQSAMAWQVFNPAKAGVDLDEPFNRRWYARSGNQFLISWGAADAAANDDWLISPELSGEEQVVSFYIKSVSMAYTERFRVLYSRDSRSTSDFVKVAEANFYTPGGKWRKFSVRLPEGARYFAIHCISAKAFGIMVDDIGFVPAGSLPELDLLGYNVYRDGVKINEEPLTETSFTDKDMPQGVHSYAVTTLFEGGESSPSPLYVAGGSSVEAIAAPSEDIAVTGHTGWLEISVGGKPADVVVYSADGRMIMRDNVSGSCTYSLPAGIYIVRGGSSVFKVLVK